MKRSLGFWQTWGLVVGSTVGSAIFVLPALLAPYESLSLVGWLLAALSMIAVAMSLGSLAKRVPRIGGPYAYVREAFGELPAFLVAWSYWISVWAGVASIAVAFAGYLGVFIPALIDKPYAAAACAIGAMWLFTVVNIAGVKTAARLNLILTVLKLLPLLAVGVFGVMLGEIEVTQPVTPPDGSYLFFLGGLYILAMGAFVGLEAGTIPADDVIAPEKTIPRALILGTLTISVIYIVSTAGVMALVSSEELAQSSSPFSAAGYALFGTWGSQLVAIGAIISIVGVLNVTILLTGQMPRAAALDGLFPTKLSQINKKGSPAVALIFSTALATVLVSVNFSSGIVAAYEVMFLLTTLTAIVVFAACALADLVLQLRDSKKGQPLRWQPIAISATALVASVFAIIGSGIEATGYTLILLIAGLPVFIWQKRKTKSGSFTST